LKKRRTQPTWVTPVQFADPVRRSRRLPLGHDRCDEETAHEHTHERATLHYSIT